MLLNTSMKRIIFGLLLLSLPFQYSCKEKIVRYYDSGKTITMMVNQVLKIELPGDAASSSGWRKLSYNDSIFLRKGKSHYMLSSDGRSPGVYYFRFLAVAPGNSKIKLEFGHKYDAGKKATKTFELDVVVVPQH